MTDNPSSEQNDGVSDEYLLIADRWSVEGFRPEAPFDADLVLHSPSGALAAPLDPALVADLLDVLHDVDEAQRHHENGSIGGPIGRQAPYADNGRRYGAYDHEYNYDDTDEETRGSRGWQNVTGYPQMNILWANMSIQARAMLCAAAILVVLVLAVIPKIF